MAALTSASFCLICFLICSSEALEKITADLGQDVILPCKVPNKYNKIKNIRVVEWIRPDQDPEYVLFYRDGRLDPDNQHEFYQNRVDLQDKQMKDGDASLILKNVTMEDRGKYVCRVFQGGTNRNKRSTLKTEPISITILEVLSSAQTNLTAKTISADLGQDVILPCEVPNNIIIGAVQWSRPDQDPEYAVFYWNGHINPDNQHPSYQNRVDLQDKEMKDGDVSLILKNVKMEDRGTYECYVAQGGTNRRKRSGPELISNTYLEVLPSEDKDGGGKSGIIRDEGNKIGEDISRGHPGAVVGGILLLLAVLASLGFLMYKRHMRQNPNLSVPPDEPTAEQSL